MLVKGDIFIFPKQQDKVWAIAVLGELDRFPSMNNLWTISVKYWVRLVQSTVNVLLKAAFETVSTENHNWFQGIYNCLTQNGFMNIWFDPPGVNNYFTLYSNRSCTTNIYSHGSPKLITPADWRCSKGYKQLLIEICILIASEIPLLDSYSHVFVLI